MQVNISCYPITNEWSKTMKENGKSFRVIETYIKIMKLIIMAIVGLLVFVNEFSFFF